MSSPEFQELDICRLPLEGVHLVEADAGTGKTYSITSLFLRLIVQAGLRVSEILVVTYTRAATAELQARIRRRLRDARSDLARGDSEDPVVHHLMKRGPSREESLERLRAALASFDQAAIFTIHGFCQRVLARYPLATDTLFNPRLEPSDGDLLRSMVYDFWRSELESLDGPRMGAVLDRWKTPDALLREVLPYVGRDYLTHSTPPEPKDLDELLKTRQQAWSRIGDAWPRFRGEVAELLTESPVLHKGRYTPAGVSGLLEDLDVLSATEEAPSRLPEKFHLLTPEVLAKATRKNQLVPEHPFFAMCGEVMDAYANLEPRLNRWCFNFRRQLLQWVDQAFRERHQISGSLEYDDLVRKVHEGLQSQDGDNWLAQRLAEEFPAALIDEFQDTDPMQLGIFQAIYGNRQHGLFLVGDPKQSIYSFRSADLYAYLRGRRLADGAWRLRSNWRSDEQMVAAVNCLFKFKNNSLVIDKLDFSASTSADARDLQTVSLPGPGAALQFAVCPQRLDVQGRAKAMGKDAAEGWAATSTAEHVAELLNAAAEGEAHIGDRTLQAGDIAVLVRTNQQARRVQEALGELGIASALTSDQSVFLTQEATELQRILVGLASPHREELVRSALTTDLLGTTGDELIAMSADDASWGSHMEMFLQGHRRWVSGQFAEMLYGLLDQYECRERLLALQDGDRRVTNILQLVELTTAQWRAAGNGVDDLLAWFVRQCEGDTATGESAAIRLESDENLVQVLTIHRSKGLEYGVVFCPFLWSARDLGREPLPFLFHDPQRDDAAVLELGDDNWPENLKQAFREQLAEEVRLVYVALTRAQHRCYVHTGAVNQSCLSGLYWLLHRGDTAAPEVQDLKSGFSMRAVDYEADVLRLAENSGGSVALTHATEPGHRAPAAPATSRDLRARHFEGEVRVGRSLTSFSALVARHDPELPDYDALSIGADLSQSPEPGSIHAFPAGRRVGSCLHALFEHWDFTEDDAGALREHVRSGLTDWGFSEEWVPAVAEMMSKVLATPLDGRGLNLGGVSAADRLDEMEFHYPVQLDGAELAGLLNARGYSSAADIISSGRGHAYMRGFVDLVFRHQGRFFVVDYKSNRLGDSASAYQSDRLGQIMAAEGYTLQYLLYTLALHRYLRNRLRAYDYAENFGGVHYLFLRGMSPDEPAGLGVYSDMPPQDLVESMDLLLKGKTDEPL